METTVIGYGWDSWHNQKLTETLEQTTKTVVDDTVCNEAISQYMAQTWTQANYTKFLAALGPDALESPPNALRCQKCIICAVGKYVLLIYSAIR